ncbi:hypothetical protein [uncultured Sphingomonas sp.]|uniref:hypothetical protein n=1 Tax=uncultured Sphingomonas sp. TaxID=158754 RepID=UPI0025E138C8|nr:hypothetical protein [uncultured Sphingomonas sp.]
MEQPVSQIKAIREHDAVNGYIAAADQNFSRARYEYLVTRRDQMQDRLRFGAMALNGASLAGLMAAMGGDGKAASWAGLSGTVALWSATAFILGITCAGVAALIASNKYTTESGDAFKRYMTAKRLAATYEGGDWDQASGAMEEHHESPLVDFQYSTASIALQNAAHGCWLAGICLPVLTKFFG